MAYNFTEGDAGGGACVLLPQEDTMSSVGYSQGFDYQAESVSHPSSSSRAIPGVRNYLEAPVRVAARFRPPVTDEEFQDDPVFVLRTGDNSTEIDRGVAEAATVESCDGRFTFEFDCAFSEEANQQSVYERIGQPAVDEVLAGYNGTILTYGQTGSGKTFTLFGPSFTEPELRGIAPRAAEQLVRNCIEGSDIESESIIQCSFLEIYRERMRDLLHPTNQSLRIKELPGRGLFIDGLTQDYVGSASDVLKALSTGSAWRSVAATRQNQYSSRSHAIFALQVSRRTLDGEDIRERSGKLSLVDLAGSERVSRSQSVGETLEEAKKINSSLTALGKVIDSLVERRAHVPYRDSTLTRVLEEALGGNSHTTLLVAASACAQHLDETVCSLRFATRAQKVKNCAHVNFVYTADELLPLVGQLQRELAMARRELAQQQSCASVPRGVQQGKRHCRNCSGSFEEDAGHRMNQAPKSSERETTATVSVSAGFSRLSTWSTDTACSTSSGSRPPSDSLRGLHEDEDGAGMWTGHQQARSDKALAASATAALRCLEETLLAQEQALEQARLLMYSSDASGVDRAGFAPSTSSRGGEKGAEAGAGTDAGMEEEDIPMPVYNFSDFEGGDAISDRWNTLRHAVEARALRWRLQRERHKSEGLQHELGLRNRYSAELERRLEASQAELALLSQGTSQASVIRHGSTARERSPNVRSGSKSRQRLGSSPNSSQSAWSSQPASHLSKSVAVAETSSGNASCEQLRALREAQCALRGEVLELKQELNRKDRQMAGLTAEIAARDVRLSTLRHEVGVKDALLGCLRRETWKPVEAVEEELERLIETAAAPLAALLKGSHSGKSMPAPGKPMPTAVIASRPVR